MDSHDHHRQRVTGIGGIFFRCKQPDKTTEWYKQHLGINVPAGLEETGAPPMFVWRDDANPEQKGYTVWGPFPHDTDYFKTNQEYMVNYRVEDIDAIVADLQADGIEAEPIEEHPQGRFTWIHDPEGVRIELWEPAERM